MKQRHTWTSQHKPWSDPWRGYFTVADMLADFLGAPAADGRINVQVIESVVGASVGRSCIDVVDPATYDGASGRHDAKCRTFRQAFRACAEPYDIYGHRHWRTFDLRTLQECHRDFRALRLPEWVEQRIVEEQLAEHYRALGDELATDADSADEVSDAAIDALESIPF